MSEDGAGADPTLVILAAGRARRYGGCKPLAPVGTHGEAVIDLVASDAVAAGFGTIVLVLGPSTGPAIRYHVEHTWPEAVDVRFATQSAPLGTVHAVLSASDHVGDTPYGVGNADDIYGRAACAQLVTHLRAQADVNALVGYRLDDAVVGTSPVTRGICRIAEDGMLLGVDERRQVTRTPDGGFDKTLQSAMESAVDASEESEVLLPEVVADSLTSSSFSVLSAQGRCIGVTHPDDLSLVQAELNRQVAAGERPASLWASTRQR